MVSPQPICQHSRWPISVWNGIAAEVELPKRRPLWLTLVVLLLVGTMAPAEAQNFLNGRVEMATAQILSPPRSLRQDIRLVREAIEQERTSEAVVKLGELMRRLPTGGTETDDQDERSQDYLLIPETIDPSDWSTEGSGEDLPASTIRLIRRMIGQLPENALEIYELRYGPLATKTLTEAAAKRDWDAVESVRREYFHTQAGYQASAILAQREWQLGNPLAVSTLLDEVVSVPRAIQLLGEDIVVLHAAARHLSGGEVPFAQPIPASVAAGMNKPANQIDASEWSNWIRNQFEATDVSDSKLKSYPLLGGEPERNGLDDGQMPLSHPRWMLETSASPRQERAIDRKTNELRMGGRLPPPSWTPLKVGDQLLMRTTQRLLGVDYRTGKRVWQYPWFSSPEPDANSVDVDLGMTEEETPDAFLSQRVWNDVPYGQLSSDGLRAYMIDDLNQIEIQRFGAFGMQGMNDQSGSTNTLVALDLSTEGKLLWRLGAGETSPSTLGEAFFLGPPLPYRGKLYVLVEMAGEVSLVCLRPTDGSQEWRQVLLSIESGGVANDPIRRVAGATPSLHQGILICPTGAGVTIAVDLIDRTLRWANMHLRSTQFVHSVFNNSADLSLTELGQRWSGPVAIASGRSVVLSPPESDRLIVADVLTGKNRFDSANRIHDFYVAGIRGERYFVVEGGRMKAFSLDSGAMAWASRTDLFGPGQRVSGRGVFGTNSYFLPTTSNELIEIALSDGSLVARREVQYPLGNLIAVDGEVISQSTTMLAVAYGQSTLQPVVDEILARDPDDFTAMIRKAELLMEQDDRSEALRLLQRARTLEPDNVDVQMLSVSAMLGTLREDPHAEGVDLDELEKLIDKPEQRAQLLVLRIRGLLEPSDDTNPSADTLTSAMRFLCELSILAVSQPELNDNAASVFPQSQRPMTLDSWISSQVQTTVSLASSTDVDAITAIADDRLAQAIGADVVSHEQTIRHFTALRNVDPMRVNLARRYMNSEDPLAVERVLIGDREATDPGCETLPLSRLGELANLYTQTQWTADEQRISELLATREGKADAPTEDDPKKKLPVDELIDELGIDPSSGLTTLGSRWQSPADWAPFVSLQWQNTTFARTRSSHLERSYDAAPLLMGDHLKGWQFLRDDNSPLWILNPYGIPRLLPIEGLGGRDSGNREVVISGGLMIMMTPAELIAIDLFQILGQATESPIRWRRSLGPEGEPIAKKASSPTVFGNQIFRYRMNSVTANANEAELRLGPVLGDRLFVLQGEELVCLDALTGVPIWRTHEFSPGGTVVAGDGKVAVVSDRHNRVAVFNILDGTLIEDRQQTIGSILMSSGRHVLVVSPVSMKRAESNDNPPDFNEEELKQIQSLHEPQLVELLDPIANRSLLRRIVSPVNREDKKRTASFGQIVDGRYFALLDTAGRVTVWDVLWGKSPVDTMIAVTDDVFDLAAMHVQDQMILLPRRRNPNNDLGATTTLTVSGGASVSPLTSIVAVSMTDGSVRWTREFEEPWGCTTQQPWATPMLVLVRARSFYNSPVARRRELDVMALDVNTGETRHEIASKNTSSRHNSIETQVRLLPHRDEVLVEMQGETLTYQFHDEKPAATTNGEVSPADAPEGEPIDEILEIQKRMELRMQQRQAVPVPPPAIEPPELPDAPE